MKYDFEALFARYQKRWEEDYTVRYVSRDTDESGQYRKYVFSLLLDNVTTEAQFTYNDSDGYPYYYMFSSPKGQMINRLESFFSFIEERETSLQTPFTDVKIQGLTLGSTEFPPGDEESFVLLLNTYGYSHVGEGVYRCIRHPEHYTQLVVQLHCMKQAVKEFKRLYRMFRIQLHPSSYMESSGILKVYAHGKYTNLRRTFEAGTLAYLDDETGIRLTFSSLESGMNQLLSFTEVVKRQQAIRNMLHPPHRMFEEMSKKMGFEIIQDELYFSLRRFHTNEDIEEGCALGHYGERTEHGSEIEEWYVLNVVLFRLDEKWSICPTPEQADVVRAHLRNTRVD